MNHAITFSSTTLDRFTDAGAGPKVRRVVASSNSRTEVIGTGAITGFVISQKPYGFNFDLARMTSGIESEEILMPSDLHSVEELDAWLMGLNLE
ncbi:hypothetical protein [Klebsiella aerogenes]|uniref:hypothetical protein n=1 Tax=Klebsiella aerogenes TaxID=548 RepID=UPI0007500CE3|nr:hypothetical protein [Klebsiella aerogenes]AXY31197.1 hypothetical protein CEQ05_24025 [Klebsiella aerogenes]EKZ6348289.1 hypothetical protein [Klebsiella aerogenes]KUQ34174.1 hypothetical protein AWI14_18055 [Klebsiella aerogenes]KZR35013.1 hypothetical protein A3N60_09660 [Klebsiella aerogenes]HBQ2464200.1 hypothetical protein [Klebsiella aerogenes]